MYESTPQHVIDEASLPGPVAIWMDSSSSDSSSSSSSDSDNSRGSNTTAKRFKRVMRRRRRKSSAGSRETDLPARTRTPSVISTNGPIQNDVLVEEPATSPGFGNFSGFGHRFGAIDHGDEADDEHAVAPTDHVLNEKDAKKERKREKKHRKHERKHRHKKSQRVSSEKSPAGIVSTSVPAGSQETVPTGPNEPRRVDFAVADDLEGQRLSDPSTKRPFTLRGLTIRPAIPKTFSQNVFTQPSPSGSPHLRGQPLPPSGPIPRVRYGIRRTNSLPDRLNEAGVAANPHRVNSPYVLPVTANSAKPETAAAEEENISRTTAVLLLLISTGLVAVCAEFMVGAIDAVTTNTGLSATFVGLIILPIVGNAAEHVTAVTVASKNKMDLAIGVAVGSSIQIGTSIFPSSPISTSVVDLFLFSLFFSLCFFFGGTQS